LQLGKSAGTFHAVFGQLTQLVVTTLEQEVALGRLLREVELNVGAQVVASVFLALEGRLIALGEPGVEVVFAEDVVAVAVLQRSHQDQREHDSHF
jgi:hypothetical protein